MTSGKFFFNLLKEDLRDRIWSAALAVFVFFLSLPVTFLLGFDRAYNVDRLIPQIIGLSNPFLPIVTVVGAVICAVNGFAFLHNRSKTDYWHSLPVRRETLFLVKYINGLLIYLFAYALNLILTLLLMGADGLMTPARLSDAYMTMLIHSSAYLLFYAAALAAVFLTGHTIVALIGIAVFYFYGACVCWLTASLMSEFFVTLYTSYLWDDPFGPAWGSPIMAYVRLVENPSLLFGVIAGGLLISALALFLYRRRPSEAAGTAMAFGWTRPLFKLLLSVPIALAGGLFFLSVSSSDNIAWFFFGIVLFWFAASVIAEIIYALDFRRGLDHKATSLAFLAVAICIGTIFRMDLFGYDTWMPDREKVSSIALNISSLDSGISYYELVDREGYDPIVYTSASNYRLKNMKLTGENLDLAYLLAEDGARIAGEHRLYSGSQLQAMYDNHPVLYFDVKYSLDNGKEVYRTYKIYMTWDTVDSTYRDAIETIYASEEYKLGAYPMLSDNEEATRFNSIKLYNDFRPEQMASLNEKQQKDLLEAFRKDLMNMSLKDTAAQLSYGRLVFWFGTNEYNFRNGEYPIYDSYTNTIALLEEYGLERAALPTADEILQIGVYGEGPYAYGYKEQATVEALNELTYTDKAQKEALLSALCSTDGNASFYYLYSAEPMIRISLYIDNMYGETEYRGSYYLLPDKIPEFVKKDLEL